MSDVPLVHVVILANPADDHVLVGVKLAERVRRASALAGVSADHIHTVTSTAELADVRAKLADTVIVVRGTTQVVMTTFMEAMVGHGSAIAWDASRDRYADAIRVDSDGIDPLWASLAATEKSIPSKGPSSGVTSAIEGMWRRGMIRICTGACGLISLKATTSSSE